MTKPLSPAAQAVWTAYETADCDPYLVDPRKAGIAAAIRELAYQLRLELPLGDTDADAGVFAAHRAIYANIFAIADELEGQQ
jgi:hypothetical protein